MFGYWLGSDFGSVLVAVGFVLAGIGYVLHLVLCTAMSFCSGSCFGWRSACDGWRRSCFALCFGPCVGFCFGICFV